IAMGTSWQLSHLFYADDADFMNIEIIVKVFECFYRASRLRINMNKSKLIGISVANNVVDQAANNIGCTTLTAPFSYLGSKNGKRLIIWVKWNSVLAPMQKDVWRGEEVFRSAYPRIHALEIQKDITVAEKMSHESLGHSFFRNPRSGIEQTQFDNLLDHLEGVNL
nr:RNA-directed DNA polymerase, eukaryota, reverse transcriptase zinc-binding domain protein [Tanacetum cinerariifolium]